MGGISEVANSIVSGLLQLDPHKRLALERLHSFSWTGDAANMPAAGQGSEVESLSTGSLFGSADFALPPPAPGATPSLHGSMSMISVARIGEHREPEPEREPSALLAPS